MFDCVPSSIQEVYWKFSRNDFKVRLRLYVGERQAEVVQNYQTMGMILSQAFSAKSGSDTSSGEDVVPQNKAEMTAAFKGVFG